MPLRELRIAAFLVRAIVSSVETRQNGEQKGTERKSWAKRNVEADSVKCVVIFRHLPREKPGSGCGSSRTTFMPSRRTNEQHMTLLPRSPYSDSDMKLL